MFSLSIHGVGLPSSQLRMKTLHPKPLNKDILDTNFQPTCVYMSIQIWKYLIFPAGLEVYHPGKGLRLLTLENLSKK